MPRAAPVASHHLSGAGATIAPQEQQLMMVSMAKDQSQLRGTLEKVASERSMRNPFFLIDLADIERKHLQWKTLLPRVEPFYAIKCNTDPMVLETMVGLGMGYDCASLNEIDTMLAYGVDPESIIFANPCKPEAYIEGARDANVEMMTFDNADELRKIKAIYPKSKLVLRVLADDSKSVCRLGLKFGTEPADTLQLLETAKELNLDVVGVSFHVGSGCTDAAAFEDAVLRARRVFEEGEALGFNFDLLDIGGGFPGSYSMTLDETAQGANAVPVSFADIAWAVNRSLDTHFPAGAGAPRIIAEPGRYYVSSACTLATNIIARREVRTRNEEDNVTAPAPVYMYYVNDGCYGSFNCIVYDYAVVNGKPLSLHDKNAPQYESSVWGPTCDSMDCIQRKTVLPEMQVGEWLYFEDMGAYTMCAASQFNGMPLAEKVYAYSN